MLEVVRQRAPVLGKVSAGGYRVSILESWASVMVTKLFRRKSLACL